MRELLTVVDETPDSGISALGRCDAQRVDRNFATSDGNDVDQVAFLEEDIVRHCELLSPARCRSLANRLDFYRMLGLLRWSM